jgi:hypothetical protein
MARWWETNDYDDAESPGKQDTPAGWSGPFGPPQDKKREDEQQQNGGGDGPGWDGRGNQVVELKPRERVVGALVLAGVAAGAAIAVFCTSLLARYSVTGAVPALLLAWPRRRGLGGWSCSCGTYNHEHAGVCAGCGRSRTS